MSQKDLRAALAEDRTAPARDVITITPSASPLPYVCYAIRVETAGTLTVTTLEGNSRVLNFKDGETRHVAVTHITAASGPTVIEGMA